MRWKIFAVLLLSLVMVVPVWAKVNINTASKSELETLNGIGPAKAQAIIDYRTNVKLFAVIEDIKNVSGIGDVTFGNIRDYITVGDDAVVTPPDDDDSGDDSDDESLSDGSVSSHIDTEELTAVEKKETFKIGAGRKRVAVVGAPVSFEAVVNGTAERAWFEWSFGDGGRVRGRRATHRYQFPGLYNVVLNGSLADEEAVARTQVEVVEPELSLALISGAIKMANPTKQEVNLGGWQLSLGDNVFVIPSDTLLDPGGTTIIPAEISHLEPSDSSEIVLQNPSGRITARYSAPDLARQAKIAVLQTQLMEARVQLALLTKVRPLDSDSQGLTLASSVPVLQSTTSVSVIELPRKTGWWGGLVKKILP